MRITHFVAAACLVSIAAAVAAQTATVQTAKVNYSVQPVDSQGLTLEPYALSEGLIRELRRGGYVLYLRHGPVQVGSMDNKGAANWWKTCANTQKLAPQAFNLGVTIGIALNTQKVPVEEVLTSELCRAYDSGVFLGLVTPKMIPALNPAIVFESQKKTLAEQVAGVQKLLSEPPSAGKNRVLVGHTLPPTVIHPILSTLQEAHTAIFRAEGNGRFHLVTVLSPGQWASINTLTVTDKPSAVAANAVVTTTAATPVPAAPPPPPALPLIDPTKELKGAILVERLRQGGFNLYMRHAISTNGADQNLLATPRWWENCMIQRNISDTGREQAYKVGAAIRSLKIPVTEVKAAQFCRTRDTGYLLGLGPVEVDEGLNHMIGQRAGVDINMERFKLLAMPPAKGSNTLLVSHTHSSPRNEERILGSLQEAELIVFLPDGRGGAEPVGRIPVAEWDNLVKLNNPGNSISQSKR